MILYSYKVSACQFMTQDVLTNLLGIEREGTEKKNKQTNKRKRNLWKHQQTPNGLKYYILFDLTIVSS